MPIANAAVVHPGRCHERPHSVFFRQASALGGIAYLGRIIGRSIETDAGVASESYYGGSWHSENHFMRYLTDPLGVDELEESEVPMYMAEIDRGT